MTPESEPANSSCNNDTLPLLTGREDGAEEEEAKQKFNLEYKDTMRSLFNAILVTVGSKEKQCDDNSTTSETEIDQQKQNQSTVSKSL